MTLKNSLPLVEKYRAKSFSDIQGQDLVIQEIKTFYKMFPKTKALILNGVAGTGKTSLVFSLAKEHNLELFELNASDLRNRAKLEEILKPSIQQQSLFKKGKLILIDEADGITASDRGGLSELLILIDKTQFPMIITANDIWQRKFNLLRKKCQLINVKEVKSEIILKIIEGILKKENKKIEQTVKTLIVKKSRGDVRAALNDLQTVLELSGEIYISKEVEREKQESIFKALREIFQENTEKDSIKAYDNLKMDLNEILLWVEENIPQAYHGIGLTKAQFSLSLADLFKGRIYRQQYWRFLIYQNFFLSAGISAATKLKSNSFIKYKRPSRILKIWLANQKNAKKKSLIIKYASFCHMSKKKAMKNSNLLPLILNQKIQKELDLNEKEKKYLQNKKSDLIIINNLNRFRI